MWPERIFRVFLLNASSTTACLWKTSNNNVNRTTEKSFLVCWRILLLTISIFVQKGCFRILLVSTMSFHQPQLHSITPSRGNLANYDHILNIPTANDTWVIKIFSYDLLICLQLIIKNCHSSHTILVWLVGHSNLTAKLRFLLCGNFWDMKFSLIMKFMAASSYFDCSRRKRLPNARQ